MHVDAVKCFHQWFAEYQAVNSFFSGGFVFARYHCGSALRFKLRWEFHPAELQQNPSTLGSLCSPYRVQARSMN